MFLPDNNNCRLPIHHSPLTTMLHFIAIVAPNDINHKIKEWKHYMRDRFQCKVALKSPAHITLIPPFHMDMDDESAMAELLLPFAAGRHAFPIHLKNLAAFKPRVIYVNVLLSEPLNELRTALETVILQSNRFSIKQEERPFHPHVTIANRDLQKEDFPQAWQHFQQITYEASFTADAISLLRHTGQLWEIAGSFPLGTYS
jgi:2'-5' RNA ligase